MGKVKLWPLKTLLSLTPPLEGLRACRGPITSLSYPVPQPPTAPTARLLVRIHKYKAKINGPWDEAVPHIAAPEPMQPP
jgi:hypothetical protein